MEKDIKINSEWAWKEEELDKILYEEISKLTPEKRTYLLKWIKLEFSELSKD